MGGWLSDGTLGNELFLNHWATTALTNCIIYICPPRLHTKNPTFAIIEISFPGQPCTLLLFVREQFLIRLRKSLNKPDSSVVKSRIQTPLLPFQDSLKTLDSIIPWFLKPRLSVDIQHQCRSSRSRTALWTEGPSSICSCTLELFRHFWRQTRVCYQDNYNSEF